MLKIIVKSGKQNFKSLRSYSEKFKKKSRNFRPSRYEKTINFDIIHKFGS